MELPGVALITGAGSGIGAATALAFVQAGCRRLTLTDLNQAGLQKTHDNITQYLQSQSQSPATATTGLQIHLATGDVTDPTFINNTVSETVTRFSQLDYAVNCAGYHGPFARSTETDLADLDKTMNINFRGMYLCNTAELRAMLQNKPSASGPDDVPGQRGAIVNIASALGPYPCPAAPSYCSSKGAVISLTRANATDYARDGIRVNAIAPGLIHTPMSTNNNDPESIKANQVIIDTVPLGRWGKAREIADAAVWLCSGRASFVVGSVIFVDGGITIS